MSDEGKSRPLADTAAEKGAKMEPSGPKGDNPATAGPGSTGIRSSTPENGGGTINPSAPGNTGTTPGTNAKESEEA